jgi:hypothetical protein
MAVFADLGLNSPPRQSLHHRYIMRCLFRDAQILRKSVLRRHEVFNARSHRSYPDSPRNVCRKRIRHQVSRLRQR